MKDTWMEIGSLKREMFEEVCYHDVKYVTMKMAKGMTIGVSGKWSRSGVLGVRN